MVSSLVPSLAELVPTAVGSFAAGLLESVLNGLWQGVLLTGLVAAVLRLIRRPNAATRYMVWWACLLMVVLLPAISYGWRVGAGWIGERGGSAAQLIGAAPAFLLPGGFWPVPIALAWLAVSAYLLLRLGAAYVAMQHLKRGSEPLMEDDDAIGTLVDSHPSLPRVVVRRSDGISSPMTAGLARPMILLPNQVLDSLSRAELRQVVLHELTHVERNDDRSVLAQRILEALFFFHPAVVWIGRRLDLEREIACDHRVAALTGDARAYARCLTRLAELQPASRRSLLASGALLSRRHLVRRVRVLLEDSRKRGRDLASHRIAFGATVACLAVVAWFASLSPVLEIPVPRSSDGVLTRAPQAPPPGAAATHPSARPADAAAAGGGGSGGGGGGGNQNDAVGSAISSESSRTGREGNRRSGQSTDATPVESANTLASSKPAAGEEALDGRGDYGTGNITGGASAGAGEPKTRRQAVFGAGRSMPSTGQDPQASTSPSTASGGSNARTGSADRRVGDRIDVVSGRASGRMDIADGAAPDAHAGGPVAGDGKDRSFFGGHRHDVDLDPGRDHRHAADRADREDRHAPDGGEQPVADPHHHRHVQADHGDPQDPADDRCEEEEGESASEECPDRPNERPLR